MKKFRCKILIVQILFNFFFFLKTAKGARLMVGDKVILKNSECQSDFYFVCESKVEKMDGSLQRNTSPLTASHPMSKPPPPQKEGKVRIVDSSGRGKSVYGRELLYADGSAPGFNTRACGLPHGPFEVGEKVSSLV